ncbi:unnamed protein product [Amaranthus hypochondriacus]
MLMGLMSIQSLLDLIVAGISINLAATRGVSLAMVLPRKKDRKYRSRVIRIIIPARFASSRFEGKPLVDILGKPMIQVFQLLILPLFEFCFKFFVSGFGMYCFTVSAIFVWKLFGLLLSEKCLV